MSFALAKQIVTVTVLHAVDAIGSMLSERFLGESGQYLRFNIDGRTFPDRTATFIAAFQPAKGGEFPRQGAVAGRPRDRRKHESGLGRYRP
jgi:hypothetical protein